MPDRPVLHHYAELPPGLIDTPAAALRELLGGPSLIEIPGRRDPPVFLSVLLHGNEPTGFLALQEVLRRHAGGTMPRSLVVFIGNVEAAAFGVRRLEGQPDYNRIWPGGREYADSAEATIAARVVERMRRRGLFASLDIHNNTGRNPHYGCINRLDIRYLALASLFSRTMVYFTRPLGVQSLAFADLCPAVTVECGRPDQPAGIAHAAEFIDAVLHLSAIPHRVAQDNVGLFQTVARVRVPPGQPFGFGDGAGELALFEDIDRLNFQVLPPGTALGRYAGTRVPLLAEDGDGVDVTAGYFALEQGELVTTRPFMPSMLTLDAQIIRQDCLCYIMMPVEREAWHVQR